MSRIGKKPIEIPAKVEIAIDGNTIKVNGPKGTLTRTLRLENVNLSQEDKSIVVSRKTEDRFARAEQGLTRSLIANMVEGVSNGFSRKLLIAGTGYKAEVQGQQIKLNLGQTHDIMLALPDGIECTVDGGTTVTVAGIDKESVGHVAARIRGFKPMDPYKGKGVQYSDEHVRRKAGKAGAK